MPHMIWTVSVHDERSKHTFSYPTNSRVASLPLVCYLSWRFSIFCHCLHHPAKVAAALLVHMPAKVRRHISPEGHRSARSPSVSCYSLFPLSVLSEMFCLFSTSYWNINRLWQTIPYIMLTLYMLHFQLQQPRLGRAKASYWYFNNRIFFYYRVRNYSAYKSDKSRDKTVSTRSPSGLYVSLLHHFKLICFQ